MLKPPLPEFFGKLSASLDYFRIEVNDGVSQVGEQNILDRCYSSPTDFTPDTGFCRLVSRDPLNNNQLTVLDNYINLARDVSKGWEFNLRYQKSFGAVDMVLNALITKYDEQSNQLFRDDPVTDFNGIIGIPDWTGTGSLSLGYEFFTLRYGLDWVGGDSTRTYAYFEEDPAVSTFHLKVPDYFLHHLSLQYEIEKFEFTFGVRNLFDRDPPRVTTTFDLVYNMVGNAPLYSGYDYNGRTFFVAAAAKF